MKALFIILNDGKKIQDLTNELASFNIRGGTIIDGQGMYGDFLFQDDDPKEASSLLMMLSQGKPLKKILVCVLPDHKVADAKKAVENVLGDINNERTAVFFTVPADNLLGFTHLKEEE